MPPVRMRGDGRKARNPGKTLLRLLSYLKQYWYILVAVFVCIVINAIAQTTGSVALGTLVDKYILPMVETQSEDFAPIMGFLVQIVGIYVVGIIAAFLLNFLMVGVTQGVQKSVRDETKIRCRCSSGTPMPLSEKLK